MLLSFVLFGCNLSIKATESKANEENYEQSLFYISLFIDAKRAEFKGEIENAIEILNQIILKNPDNNAAYFELSRLYEQTSISKAIDYGEKALSLDEQNAWYLQNLSNLYYKSGEYKKAVQIVERQIKLQPFSINHYYQLVNVYVKLNSAKGVIDSYNRIEQKFGIIENISLRKKDIYLSQKKYSNAIDEINKLITSDSTNIRYYGILADIYMAAGDEAKAIDLYQQILNMNPEDGKANLVLSSYYNSKGDQDESFEQLKAAFRSSGLNVDKKIEIMLRMYKITADNPDNTKLNNQADTLLKILVKKHPENAKVLAMRGDFLIRDLKWDDAKKVYTQVIALDSSNYIVWEQLILICRELQDYSAMQNFSRRAMEIFPQYPILYFFNAKSLMELKRFSEAEASLNLGLSFVYKPQQEAEFYTQLGKLRDAMQHFDEAEISFQKGLMANANDPELLMEYALHLAIIGQEKIKAKEMGQKAMELKMNDLGMITRYAKMLLLVGDYENSVFWVNKGLKISPSNKELQNLLEESEHRKGINQKDL